MGSNETATATTGGPLVIDVFAGNGCHRAQIIYDVAEEEGFASGDDEGAEEADQLHFDATGSLPPRQPSSRASRVTTYASQDGTDAIMGDRAVIARGTMLFDGTDTWRVFKVEDEEWDKGGPSA